MSVCPFCKAQVAQSTAPCPRCAKLAAEHPSIAAISGRTLSTDFDEEDHGELSLESGSSVGHGSDGSHGVQYEGSKGMTLDDDLFGDEGGSGPLELDVPDLPVPPRAPDLAPPSGGPASGASKKPAPISDPRIAAPAPAPTPTSSSKMPADDESGAHPIETPHAAHAAHDRPPPSAHDQAAVKIANFPAPPQKILQAPRYALRVLYRQFELRQDLESLRRKRSPDVALYERALKSHDPRMYTMGLAITGIAFFLATVLFFMPVIKRFAFAPD